MLWMILLSGCGYRQNVTAVEEPSLELTVPYLEGDVIYDASSSLWLDKSDSSEVTGVIVSHFDSGIIAKIVCVLAGKKHGPQITYFPNGRTKFYEVFALGKLEGLVKRWGIQEGYRLIAELHYNNGRLDGLQRKWYHSGELHKVLNMEMGAEVGLQQAFRKNGVLYANYEAINGRTFGMRRSSLCYELQNEEVVYQ